jgi:hypothetical protein
MRKSVALSFAAVAVAAIVAGAGCSGSGYTAATSSTPTPVPLPSATCSLPANETVQMVFPQASAPAAPNLQGVVFAVAPNPLPTSYYFYVTTTVGTTTTTTLGTAQIGFLATPSPNPTVAPTAGATAVSTGTPLPTPSDTPLFANPIYEVASIGTFANNTTFTVYLANTGCTPTATTFLKYNTFTTALTDEPTPTPTPTATST